MTERRYRLDAGVRRYERVVVGGSPLTLFRLTDAGAHVVDRIAAGEPVGDSQLVDALLDAGAIHPDLDETSSTPYTTADVTVIVPTFGALRHAPTGAIVVDDGSTTPVPGATIRLDHNRGPGAARNAGLERVTTPLVAFVDADVALTDGWLDPLLPHFADDRVGLVAPRVTTPANGSVLARYEAGHSPLDLGDTVGRVHPGVGSATCRRRRSSPGRRPWSPSTASTRRSATGRTSTWSGG